MTATHARRWFFALTLSTTVWFPMMAPAQQAVQPPQPALRASATISALDRQTVQKWVDALLDQLFLAATPEREDPKFLAQVLEQYNAQGATPAFKEAVSRSFIASLPKRYAGKTSLNDSNLPRPVTVVHALLAMNTFADAGALDLYMKALADDTAAGVRLLAAEGLISIKPKLNAQQWSGVVAAVQKAGESEPDPVVLGRYYRLLATDSDARSQDAMLKVLDARLNRFEQKNELPAVADRLAAEWLGPRAVAMNNAANQNQITLRMARLLADCVYAYGTVGKLAERKEPIERVILSADAQLKAIATPKAAGKAIPDVTKAMLDGGPAQVDKMQAEVDRWIGTASAPGLLNAAPFNLPTGLAIKRPATAPATTPD